MKLSKFSLLLASPLLVAVHGAGVGKASGSSQLGTMNFMSPLDDKTTRVLPHSLLRGLQQDTIPPAPTAGTISPATPPEPPDLPDDVDEDGVQVEYCKSVLYLFLEAQANAAGYDCDCVSDDVKDTVNCTARSMTCDAYNVGDVDMICHYDHSTSSATKGYVDEEGYKIWTYEGCATYSDPPYAPDNLAGSEFCFVYQLTAVWGVGYNLDECGLTYQAAGGTPQQVCTCALCFTGEGHWGLGLDCQEALLPGITLVQCQPFFDTNPAVIPLIEEYSRQDTDPTDEPASTVLPATTPVATVPATTVAATFPATTVAATVPGTTPAATVPATTVSATQAGEPVNATFKFPNLSMSMLGVTSLTEPSWDVYVKEYQDFYTAFYAANPFFGVTDTEVLLELVSQDPPLVTRHLGESVRQLQDQLTLVYNLAITYTIAPDSLLEPPDVVTQPFATQTSRDAFAALLRESGDAAFANIESVSVLSQAQPTTDPATTPAATVPATTVAATTPAATTVPATTVAATTPAATTTVAAATTDSPPIVTTTDAPPILTSAANAIKLKIVLIAVAILFF